MNPSLFAFMLRWATIEVIGGTIAIAIPVMVWLTPDPVPVPVAGSLDAFASPVLSYDVIGIVSFLVGVWLWWRAYFIARALKYGQK